jgi:CBS domain containing-hemolysin-like protein
MINRKMTTLKNMEITLLIISILLLALLLFLLYQRKKKKEVAPKKTAESTESKKLFKALSRFQDKIVKEIMIPRVSLFALEDNISVKEAADLFVKEAYSRVPVYQGDLDHIIGLLLYKDLFAFYHEDPSRGALPISSLLKPAIFTPETKSISTLLQELKKGQLHLAIVVDEYGGTEGIVTIEDIIEEIVGDIADEYDSALSFIQQGKSWIIDAKMSLLDIEEHFSLFFKEEGDFDTIGGFIYYKAGVIPKKGFKIIHDLCEIEVLSSSERAIKKVRLTPIS